MLLFSDEAWKKTICFRIGWRNYSGGELSGGESSWFDELSLLTKEHTVESRPRPEKHVVVIL